MGMLSLVNSGNGEIKVGVGLWCFLLAGVSMGMFFSMLNCFLWIRPNINMSICHCRPNINIYEHLLQCVILVIYI